MPESFRTNFKIDGSLLFSLEILWLKLLSRGISTDNLLGNQSRVMKTSRSQRLAKSSEILMGSGGKLKGLFKCQTLKATHPNFTSDFKYLSKITNLNSSTLVCPKNSLKKIFTKVMSWLSLVSSLAPDPLSKKKPFSSKARQISMMNLDNKRTQKACITTYLGKKSKLLTILH